MSGSRYSKTAVCTDRSRGKRFSSCTEISQESIECPIISQRYRDCLDMEAEAEQSNLAIIMSKVILHGNSSMHWTHSACHANLTRTCDRSLTSMVGTTSKGYFSQERRLLECFMKSFCRTLRDRLFGWNLTQHTLLVTFMSSLTTHRARDYEKSDRY